MSFWDFYYRWFILWGRKDDVAFHRTFLTLKGIEPDYWGA